MAYPTSISAIATEDRDGARPGDLHRVAHAHESQVYRESHSAIRRELYVAGQRDRHPNIDGPRSDPQAARQSRFQHVGLFQWQETRLLQGQ